MVGSPEEWKWSGYRAAAGISNLQRFHQPNELWGLFDKQPRLAMGGYERFVREGLLGP
jgi:hypothetical protein